MAAEKIGNARCPLCGGTARVSLSKNKLTVMTMNCCNAQLFTRSDRSDELVRALILQEKPAETPAPAATAPAETRTAPAATPTPEKTPEPVRTESRSPFSIF